MWDNLLKYKVHIAIGILWLFHISAIIGISLGHLNWFVQKTPLNLSLSLLLFILIFPLNTLKKGIAFILFFAGGMFAEWLGVNYGILFGEYEYGYNFGPKLDGVPYLIGVYWALLTFVTASILDYTRLSTVVKIILAAGLMVLLDFFMEQSAPVFDFWTFDEKIVPLENYVTWFVIAFLFQVILRSLRIEGNKSFSLNIYMAQLFFFIYFFIN